MLSFNQFLTYCTRNNIHSVIVTMDWVKEEDTAVLHCSTTSGTYTTPHSLVQEINLMEFYIGVDTGYYGINLDEVVKNHMRMKCEPLAKF